MASLADKVKSRKSLIQNNPIKDAINDPKTIVKNENIKQLFEYDNPKVAILCQKKLAEYNMLALAVRMKILGSQPIINTTANAINDALGTYSKGIGNIEGELKIDENFVSGAVGNPNKIPNSIPTCLQESSNIFNAIKDVVKSISSLFADGGNKFIEFIEKTLSQITSMLSKAKDTIMEFIDPVIEVAKKIINVVKKVLNLILDAVKAVLFSVFDAIKSFIDALGLKSDLKKLRDWKYCLETHCKPNIPFMVDLSDVLPNMRANMPIDQYSGEFRVYQFSNMKLNSYNFTDSNSRRILSEMDSDYIQYSNVRESKMNELVDQVSNVTSISKWM